MEVQEVQRRRILERAGHKCEKCGAKEDEPHPVTTSRVALTIVHLNDDPTDDSDDTLRALCQCCQALHDARRRAYRAAIAAGCSPADIEDAFRDAEAAGEALPTDAEIEEDAQITDLDIERSRQWWTTAVPDGYKRLLDAEEEVQPRPPARPQPGYGSKVSRRRGKANRKLRG